LDIAGNEQGLPTGRKNGSAIGAKINRDGFVGRPVPQRSRQMADWPDAGVNPVCPIQQSSVRNVVGIIPDRA